VNIDFSNDNKYLVAGLNDKSIKVFSTNDWSVYREFTEHTGGVWCV
jgi:WD40 repeat protein